MADEFDGDLAFARKELDISRRELLAVVGALADADLGRERRGGWRVGRVLEHVIQSEWLYARLVTHLRELPVEGEVVSGVPSSVEDAKERLNTSHAALLGALDGVDEVSYYRLREVGHEEYSVLSVVENQVNHDREHAEQVRTILDS